MFNYVVGGDSLSYGKILAKDHRHPNDMDIRKEIEKTFGCNHEDTVIMNIHEFKSKKDYEDYRN